MSDNVENLNVNNDNLIAQVQNEVKKAKREKLKAAIKKNIQEIDDINVNIKLMEKKLEDDVSELKKRIALLEEENLKTVADFNSGLI